MQKENAVLFYETEKHEILRQLPNKYVSSFGELGFCQGRPVQILSPYQVPLGALRQEWMQAFMKVCHDDDDGHVATSFANFFHHISLRSKQLRLKGTLFNLPYLLYWFDSPNNEPEVCLSLKPCSQFIDYEKGVENNLDALPKHIGYKFIHNWKPCTRVIDYMKDEENIIFTDEEKLLMSGLHKLHLAHCKPKDQRTLPFDVVPDNDLYAPAPTNKEENSNMM